MKDINDITQADNDAKTVQENINFYTNDMALSRL